MSELVHKLSGLIDSASPQEQRSLFNYLRKRVELHPLERAWGTTAEAILASIARSPDITHRGIRGILAEATFEEVVLPLVEAAGWKASSILAPQAYDFLLTKEKLSVSIQVKLQRKEKQVPKEYPSRSRATLKCPTGTIYTVEVQKTRSGVKGGKKTRPYRFGEFDILAVNLHPSTGDWKRYIYTVGSWLLSQSDDPSLIETFQPVPDHADEYWTYDLEKCIDWFLDGSQRALYS
jgi:hypothetical protein